MSKLTTRDAIEQFVFDMRRRDYSERTITSYQASLRRFFEYQNWVAPDWELNTVTIKDLLNYHLYLDEKNLAPSTKAASIGTLRRFYRFLKRKEWLLLDPTEGLPSFKIPKSLPRSIMSEKEVELLLAQPNLKTLTGFRDRAIMEVLYSSAIRRMELRGLNLYDIYTQRGFLRVLDGKGKKDRVVPLGKVACDYVREYLTVIRPDLLKGQARKVLFISRTGSPLAPGSLSALIHQYVKKTGFRKPVSCHTFRHTRATLMLKGGSSIRYVQEMLGHADISTTQIYTRVLPLDLKKVLKKAHPQERLKKKEAPAFAPKTKAPVFFRKLKSTKTKH